MIEGMNCQKSYLCFKSINYIPYCTLFWQSNTMTNNLSTEKPKFYSMDDLKALTTNKTLIHTHFLLFSMMKSNFQSF